MNNKTKQLYDLFMRAASFEGQMDLPFGVHCTSGSLYDSHDVELVIYHHDGYRFKLKKTKWFNVEAEGFSWDDYEENPEDFDEEGFAYEFYSDVEEEGFKECDEKMAMKLMKYTWK